MSALPASPTIALDSLPPLGAHTGPTLRCPRRVGQSRLDPSTGELRDRDPCGAWWCPGCGLRKQREAERRVRLGLDWADESGRAAALLTLTLRPGVEHLGLARASYGRVVQSARRGARGCRFDSVWVVEFGRADPFVRGRLHLHAVALHGLSARDLADLCRRRFGHVVVKPVGLTSRDREGVAGYVAKDLAATAVQLHRGGGGRVTPITFGRSWPSIPMQAERRSVR